MNAQQGKIKASYLLAVPALFAIVIAIHYGAGEDASFMGYISGFFQELLGGGKTVWEKIIFAGIVIGVGNALFMPINVLLVATAIFLPGWPAFGACMFGALLAAALGYGFGFFVDDSYLKEKFGEKYELATREICKDGLKSVIILCFAPIAPNLLTNVLAGVCRVHLWKLFLGTIIGFLPGITILTLLGRKIRHMVEEPGWQTGVWLIALAALLFLSYKISKRVQAKIGRKESKS